MMGQLRSNGNGVYGIEMQRSLFWFSVDGMVVDKMAS